MNRYLEWLCSKVGLSLDYYSSLALKLFNTPFFVINPMDMNRYLAGMNLQKQYAKETGGYFPETPCSVLEMIIALAIKCEEVIMADEDHGDRTSLWFCHMVENLGIFEDDSDFDEEYADYILRNLNNRTYLPNGLEGCLFRTNRTDVDMREVDIWYQMHLYLNEELERE